MTKQETTRCADCGEVFRGPHDCGTAREARALFEAAKRANSREGADHLGRMALAKAVEAEVASDGR